MFEGLSSKFKSVAESAKNMFSRKSPDTAKAATLPPEVDARPEINQRVSDAMQDKAMDAWARGEGWNTGTKRIPGRLDNVVLDLPQRESQKYKFGLSQEFHSTAEQAKFTEPVDSPRSVFAAFGDAARFDETPLTQPFLEEAREAMTMKQKFAPRVEAANDDVYFAGTNVVPLFKPRSIEEATAMHPPMRPGEAPSREPRGALAMRLAAVAAAVMAVVGGAQAVSQGGHHGRKSSYSVDDIVPMTNEDAKNVEAARAAAKQRVDQRIEIAQN